MNEDLAKLMNDAKNQKAEYKIGEKKVSEYRFFKSIADEIKGKKKRNAFYWTDKNVILFLSCLGIDISQEEINEFKIQYMKL